MMASPNHESVYCFSNQDPSAQDYCQGFASLDNPAQPSLCTGQGPFLQAPTQLDQEEQHQVVVASNDLPISDMDLVNFLEMDDKTLTGECAWAWPPSIVPHPHACHAYIHLGTGITYPCTMSSSLWMEPQCYVPIEDMQYSACF